MSFTLVGFGWFFSTNIYNHMENRSRVGKAMVRRTGAFSTIAKVSNFEVNLAIVCSLF
jgi:hypothetical protein